VSEQQLIRFKTCVLGKTGLLVKALFTEATGSCVSSLTICIHCAITCSLPHSSLPAENFPGFPEPILGGDLCDRFRCGCHSWQGSDSSSSSSSSSGDVLQWWQRQQRSRKEGRSRRSCALQAMQWQLLLVLLQQ
jgi:hypothetical protein